MTRKDYKLIAEVIRQFKHSPAVRDLARCLANELAKDNERFSYSTFFDACGLLYTD